MSYPDLIHMQKGVLWEEAKGKLRAMVRVGGMTDPGRPKRSPDWEDVEAAVEAFIHDFEHDGLHE